MIIFSFRMIFNLFFAILDNSIQKIYTIMQNFILSQLSTQLTRIESKKVSEFLSYLGV